MALSRDENRWRSRPVLAAAVRTALLAVPLVASAACAYLVVRLLPIGAARSWWGLTVVLVTAVLTAVVVERGARRLLPLAVLLKLSMLFPDRAPSRLKLSRAAARAEPATEVVWSGSGARPTTTSDLVIDLVAALGAHDRRTRGHSERVRVLCDMLAEELKLDQDARDRLRWSALLHDVGKMNVAASILNKPSRLDDREFGRIRQHPQAGAELAAPLLPWLGEWGEGIVDHHEKYDGSGYPAGKAGAEISTAGRLIGLVDAFETMTAARAYKKAMATRHAREELARCAGTHFDPVLVRAFLAISLPRVLWAMGPLSFFLQLPFLPSLAQAGARAGAVGSQATAAAAGAAGAAVLATGTLAAAGDATGVIDLGSLRPPSATAERVAGEREPSEPVAEVPPAQPAAPADPVPPPRPAAEPDPVAAPTPPPASAAAQAQEPAPPAATPAEPAADPPADTPAAESPPDDQPAPAGGEPGEGGPAEDEPAENGPAEDEPSEDEPGEEPPPQDPAGSVPGSGPAIASGPPPVTTSRKATFVLRDGGPWQCQVLGNGDGDNSAYRDCSGTLVLELRREGRHTLNVRGPDGVRDSWVWTITSTAVSARVVADGLLRVDAPRGDVAVPLPAPGPALPLMALLTTLALPLATLVRRLRSRRRL